MKSNRAARRFVRIRRIVLCLALVGMVGIAYWSGESLALRFGRTTAPQTESWYPPNASLADMLASAH
jgi:hypothetical protein